MKDAALTLRHLCFTGPVKAPAIVTFGPGLNVISGASETGKSFIFESLDFMLGSNTKLRDIPERRGYDRVFLGFEDAAQETFTLERSASGGEFRCYPGLHTTVPDGIKPSVLAAKHNPNNEDNVSTFLLERIGLSNKKIRKNALGELNSLSFRTLAPFVLISEGEIQKQGSPIETGQFVTRTAEFSTFKLLLTGIDDSALQAGKRQKNDTLTRAAKIEVIDELITGMKDRLQGLVGEEDSELELRSQLSKLDEALSREHGVLNATEKQYRVALERRAGLRRKLEAAQERRSEIDELLARFRLLDQHYSSDLERLDGIREAGTLVSALSPNTCPLCGTEPKAQNLGHECDGNVESVIAAADAEKAKVERLRSELRATTDKLAQEASGFDGALPSLSTELEAAESDFEKTSPVVSEKRAAYSEVVDKRSAIQAGLTILTSIAEMEARKADVGGSQSKPENKADGSGDLSSSTLDEFAKVFEDILTSWNFPDVSRVYFDKEARDFVISGKPRGSRGKGLRAITHAAFTVALLEYAWKNELSHPGFVVLDTPLLAYREPDGDEDDLSGTDVQDRFYSYLDAHKERQVIILENVDPPSDIKNREQTQLFSRNPHQGRFGFFPLNN